MNIELKVANLPFSFTSFSLKCFMLNCLVEVLEQF